MPHWRSLHLFTWNTKCVLNISPHSSWNIEITSLVPGSSFVKSSVVSASPAVLWSSISMPKPPGPGRMRSSQRVCGFCAGSLIEGCKGPPQSSLRNGCLLFRCNWQAVFLGSPFCLLRWSHISFRKFLLANLSANIHHVEQLRSLHKFLLFCNFSQLPVVFGVHPSSEHYGWFWRLANCPLTPSTDCHQNAEAQIIY